MFWWLMLYYKVLIDAERAFLLHWSSRCHLYTFCIFDKHCNVPFLRTENTVTLIFRIKIISDISAGEIETNHHHLNNLYSNLKIIASNRPDGLVEVLHVRSSKFCHKEETYGNRTLHWPVATIGQTVLPRELCVSLEGVPVWRQCTGDFVEGAFWSDENENNGTLYQVNCNNSTLLHSYIGRSPFSVKNLIYMVVFQYSCDWVALCWQILYF